MKIFFLLVITVVSEFLSVTAYALPCFDIYSNCAPPSGAFLDLAVPNSDGSGNSNIVPSTYTKYSAYFVATVSDTNLTIAARNDPSSLYLSNVTLGDITNPTGNLLLNGDFSLGPVGAPGPEDWTYLDQYGTMLGYGSRVQSGCGQGSSVNCYSAGGAYAYDAITQPILTTPGDTYQVSFWLDNQGYPFYEFADLATNDRGTTDLLVYEGAQLPALADVPEPPSIVTVLAGLACVISLGKAAGRRIHAIE